MKKWFLLMFVAVIISGCKKSSSPAAIAPTPSMAILTYPAQNSICTEGNTISATESSIVFKWGSSENTELYELSLKNLLTGVTRTQTTSKHELEVTLLKSTPYSWYITSKTSKNGGTATSDEWKFYNSGAGVESYAPFPAEIVSPLKGQRLSATAGKITLDWNGSDADGDIAGYDVYLGTSSSPTLVKSNITESKLVDVSVSPNTGYFWKVVSKDSKGNTSDSGLFYFTVD